MAATERYCPLCERTMNATLCPDDGVETLDLSLPRTTAELITGAVVAGRYRIERTLGEGGMGSVFLATQLSMKRTVALKVLKTEVHLDAREFKRFYLEARAASGLDHPNIVRIFDFGVDA